jgi:signal transduction histidine kinase/CheY-like chemotaxis protein
LLQAINEALAESANRLIQKYRKELVSFYTDNRRFDKAAEMAAGYFTLQDSLFTSQNANNISAYEQERTESEKRKEVEQIGEQKRQQKNYFIAGLSLLAIFALFIFTRLQIIRKTKKQLEGKNKIIAIEKERAEQSEKFKQQFLANMSHEIRTPMNSVIGITHLLLRSELNEQQRNYISMIQAASEQLMSIINDILDISKIEAGKMTFEHIDFDLVQAMTNVKHILGMKADEKKLDFRLSVPENLKLNLNGDPSRLAQVLINLVGNAIKFTEKGFIEMSCRELSRSGESIEIEFSVSDSGIGIAQEKLSSIFDSFTQANSDTSRKYGGTGLGLTISKQLVDLQGGRIGLESKAGIGTRFYFTLPFKVVAGKKAEAGGLLQENGVNPVEKLHGIRILLVEDNDFNRIVAEDTLNEYLQDIRLDYAVNGIEAVEKISGGEYDLVLMDIQMPEMDGYEATKTIRSMDDSKRHLPIMAMTANATPEEINKCFESGVDEYISKPFIAEELLKKMSKILKKPVS